MRNATPVPRQATPSRRAMLRLPAAAGLHAALAALGLLPADFALAQQVGPAAFRAASVAEALKALGVSTAPASKDLAILAAEVSENGAMVDVTLRSGVPGTDFLALLVERNPTPLVCTYRIAEGVEPEFGMTAKVSESSDAILVARADGRYYMTRKLLKVTLGGCG